MGQGPNVERAAAWELESLSPETKDTAMLAKQLSLCFRCGVAATFLFAGALGVMMTITLKNRLDQKPLLTWATFELRERKHSACS